MKVCSWCQSSLFAVSDFVFKISVQNFWFLCFIILINLTLIFFSRRFRLRSLNMGRLYTVVDTLCSRFFDALLTSITAKLLSVCFLLLSFNLWWDLFISQNASKNPQQVYFSCHSNILSAFCHWLYCIHVISDIHIIRFSVWFNLSPSFSNGNAI